MLQGLVAAPGGGFPEAAIDQVVGVARIELDGLAMGRQRLVESALLLQVHRQPVVRGGELRIDRQRLVGGVEAAGQTRQIAVGGLEVRGVGDLAVGLGKLRIQRDRLT